MRSRPVAAGSQYIQASSRGFHREALLVLVSLAGEISQQKQERTIRQQDQLLQLPTALLNRMCREGASFEPVVAAQRFFTINMGKWAASCKPATQLRSQAVKL